MKLHKVTLFAVLLVLLSIVALAGKPDKKRHKAKAAPSRTEIKEAKQLLAGMGYWTGPVDGSFDGATKQALIAFQKVEGRDVNGRLTKDEIAAIRDASQPQPRDPGYPHVEVDLDRQVLFIVGDDGNISRILPVSTGSGEHYSEKGMSGTAYTPRGRFRVYNKVAGWRESPLGLLYYPSYISGGIAIHGNPAVPTSPKSHGCIRIPMFASQSVSKMLPVGTIVLVYDKLSFVSAKDWYEADQNEKTVSTVQ